MADALIKAVSVFDREELPSTAELGAVFQALGKPQPDQVRQLGSDLREGRPLPSAAGCTLVPMSFSRRIVAGSF